MADRSPTPTPGSPAPRLARWLLTRLLPASTRESLLGDLDEELSQSIVPARGLAAGRRWYWRQALNAGACLAARWPRRSRSDRRGGQIMSTFLRDLKHATRVLAGAPGFTLVAVITLALGIGANTAIFTWLKAVALDPLPGVAAADRLVVLAGENRDGTGCCSGTSYPNFLDYRDRSRTLDGLLGSEMAPVNLSVDGRAQRVDGTIVTGNYFDVLGAKAALGRTFLPDEYEAPETHAVAVISYGLWQRVFGGHPSVINRTVSINDHPFTIVGVMPKGFTGAVVGLSFDLFVPVTTQAWVVPGPDRLHARGNGWLDLIGRLAPGVRIAQAQAEMNVISQQIARDYPGTYEGRTIGVYAPTEAPLGMAGRAFPIVVVLMIIVGLVLLIATANIANLLLARARGRRREMAVRQAMGATRARLVGQLLTENLLLSVLAGLLGLVEAVWINRALTSVALPFSGQPSLNTRIDPAVLAFTGIIVLGATLLFGLVPAFQTSGVDLASSFKAGGAGRGSGRGLLRQLLVGGQVALSVLVLVCASLFLRSLWNAQQINPGFNTGPGLLGSVDLFANGYTPARGEQFYQQLLEGAAALPGVAGATLARRPPLTFRGARGTVLDEIEGYQPRPGERPTVLFDTVGPDYFRTMGIPLVAGRDFTTADRDGAPAVVVVSAAMAQRFWPDGSVLGRHIRIGDRRIEVVGIARDVKMRSLDERPHLYMYLPVLQRYTPDETLIVRTAGDPRALVAPLRAIVQRLDPALPLFDVRTMSQQVGGSLLTRRIAAGGAAIFGLLALLLAMIGLYGVVSYSVSRRTHEIGLRIALGATASDVRRIIVNGALGSVLAGAAVGLVAAFGATRFLRALLYGVSPFDPVTFIAVPLLLVVVAALASYLPARRATRIDPMLALRAE